MTFRSIGALAQSQLGATRALLARHRKGETIAAVDQVPTIDTLVELDAFDAEIKRQGRMTDELRAAIFWRRVDLTPKGKRGAA